MTTAYFILQEPTPEGLAHTVDSCMDRYQAQPQGGVTFHGSTVYQRERCQRWLCREDPWRHEAPRWRYGGQTCDWKLLLPEDAPPTV